MPAAEVWLGADTRSAGTARRFLAATLTAWKATAYGEDAVLLLSELVANAALHAKTQIGVRIELRHDVLRLAVTDGSPLLPSIRHYRDDATTGRGLALVNRLALRWGVIPNGDGSKTVWADVGTDPGHHRGDRATTEEPAMRDAHGDPHWPTAAGGQSGCTDLASAA